MRLIVVVTTLRDMGRDSDRARLRSKGRGSAEEWLRGMGSKGGQQSQHNFFISFSFSGQPWDDFPKI